MNNVAANQTLVGQTDFVFTQNYLQLIIALAAIVACLSCMYMVFLFGRKVSETTYARPELVENAKRNEYPRLLSELQTRAKNEPLDPSRNELPPGYGQTSYFWEIGGYTEELARRRKWSPSYGSIGQGYSTIGPNETNPDAEKILKEHEQEIKKLEKDWEKFIAWEAAEKKIMEEEKRKCEEEAHKIADRKIPRSMDISLLGGGFDFLLEFSTVIIIIFSLVILGVLKILNGENIATILAAIAGYVLGKAGSTSGKSDEQSKEPKNPG